MSPVGVLLVAIAMYSPQVFTDSALQIGIPGDTSHHCFPETPDRRGGSILSRDENDSLNVSFVGNWPFGPSCCVSVDSTQSIAFLSSGGGVYILDISDPASPAEMSGCIYTRGRVMDLFYQESAGRLYAAVDENGIEVWDVQDLDNPYRLGSCDTPDRAWGIVVSGDHAYVADGDSGLRVIDVTTPSAPVEVGCYDSPGYVRSLVISGNYAYLADDSALLVIDISVPSNPTQVGYCNSDCEYGIAIDNNFIYATGYSDGLYVIDVSTPSEPVEVGSYISFSLLGLEVSDGYAYISNANIGFLVLDISSPAAPMEVGYCNTPGTALQVAVSGNYTYVADGATGLQIYQFIPMSIEKEEGVEQESSLFDIVSNPSRGSVSFRIELSCNSQLDMTVYDICGREVQLPASGNYPPGQHEIILNDLSPGVYFARVDTETSTETKKFVLIR
ncbi:MAG: T9SS type A sorting domain-containing protein [Candidatus Sabulitectum sp.]|nr:T9SS type A sorting domain-containing protein [Candidatus Sabulitectum sp.]